MKNYRVLAVRVDSGDFDRLSSYAKSIGVKKKELIGGMITRFLADREVPASTDVDQGECVTIETHTVYDDEIESEIEEVVA